MAARPPRVRAALAPSSPHGDMTRYDDIRYAAALLGRLQSGPASSAPGGRRRSGRDEVGVDDLGLGTRAGRLAGAV
ncbi:hypothetical protein GCM10010214_00040 [Streptomyces abikoensis]|nr:hypothetical protein GCM10010214_00040 [Streptomyces abikoensis]